MKKRLFAALLAMLLLLAVPALAAVRTGDWAYNVKEDGTSSIAGYIGTDGTVAFPSELDGHTVTEIEVWAFIFGNTLEDVTIPGSIRLIGDSAFAKMEKLSRVTLEEGVEIIEGNAFNGCEKLAEIVLPDSVTTLGWGAFSYSPNLERVSIGAGLKELDRDPFEGCKAIREVKLSPQNTALRLEGAMLFETEKAKLACYFPLLDGGDRTVFTVPEGTKELGAAVLSRNRDVQKIVLPQGLEVIGDSAFSECTGLEEISLPESVKRIGEFAFYGCDKLTELALPDGLEAIGNQAFGFCENLHALYVPASVTRFGDDANWMHVFDDRLKVVVEPGSEAEAYCKKVGKAFEYAQ